jgi:hypothetical protein
VMIDDKRATVIREREEIESLFSNEHRTRD